MDCDLICFLDMDGVLTDFNRQAHDYLGIPYNAHNHSLMSYDWFEGVGSSRDAVNHLASEPFWSCMPWTPEGRDLLALVEAKFTPERIYLLTKPMHNPGSWSGKRLWVEHHLSRYLPRLILTNADKSLLANPHRVLVDDCEDYCDKFLCGGGRAVLVPRMWNRLRGLDVVKKVSEQLEDIQREYAKDKARDGTSNTGRVAIGNEISRDCQEAEGRDRNHQ